MELSVDILHRHGGLVLFGVVFLEQIGLPLPALPLLVAAGVLIGTGQIGLFPAMSAALLATLLADGLWYLGGRRRGRSVLALLCKIALEPETCVRRTEGIFRTHGPHALVLAKFVPGLSTIAPPLAGIVGLGPLFFLFYDSLGTVLWAGSGMGIGYAFGAGAPDIAAQATQLIPIVGIGAAAFMMMYIIWKARRRRMTLQHAPRITATEAVERVNAGESILFVDLRPAAHRSEMPGIAGSLSLTIEDLTERAASLPKDRVIIFYCACPEDASSARATLILHHLGFETVWPSREAWLRGTPPVRVMKGQCWFPVH